MSTRILFALVVGLVLPFALHGLNAGAPAEAGSKKPAHIILDASYSMWGQIDGKYKIEIARKQAVTITAE